MKKSGSVVIVDSRYDSNSPTYCAICTQCYPGIDNPIRRENHNKLKTHLKEVAEWEKEMFTEPQSFKSSFEWDFLVERRRELDAGITLWEIKNHYKKEEVKAACESLSLPTIVNGTSVKYPQQCEQLFCKLNERSPDLGVLRQNPKRLRRDGVRVKTDVKAEDAQYTEGPRAPYHHPLPVSEAHQLRHTTSGNPGREPTAEDYASTARYRFGTDLAKTSIVSIMEYLSRYFAIDLTELSESNAWKVALEDLRRDHSSPPAPPTIAKRMSFMVDEEEEEVVAEPEARLVMPLKTERTSSSTANVPVERYEKDMRRTREEINKLKDQIVQHHAMHLAEVKAKEAYKKEVDETREDNIRCRRVHQIKMDEWIRCMQAKDAELLLVREELRQEKELRHSLEARQQPI